MKIADRLSKVLKRLDTRNTYMVITIAALGLSVAVLALILFAGDAAVAALPMPTVQPTPSAVERMTEPSPQTVDAQPIKVEISDETATGLLLLAVRDNIDVEALSAAFHAPDTLSIDARFTKDALRNFLDAQKVPMAGAILLFAPKEIELSMKIGISFSEQEGLKLDTREVETNGFKLTSHLPDRILETVNAALMSTMPDLSLVKAVTIEDGMAIIALKE